MADSKSEIDGQAAVGVEPRYVDAFGKEVEVPRETLDVLTAALGGAAQSGVASPDPRPAFQGVPALPERFWALSVQLYGLRSERNWGHGDFGDLATLVALAGSLGAAAVGLNPLHATFADRPGSFSPYGPSSRRWLNPLYADIGALPEFPGIDQAGLRQAVERCRHAALIDYDGVAAAKRAGFAAAFQGLLGPAFRERRDAFEAYRAEQGPALNRFAGFEVLRRRFDGPFWTWPAEWRNPSDARLAELSKAEAEATGLIAYQQWVAHEQLMACGRRARAAGMALGLYLDVAVGVLADGFDAWDAGSGFLHGVSIGAPPDLLNTAGQKWGLVSFNPAALAADTGPFGDLLAANMRYAGAVRLDHVLGLKRLFLIPQDKPARDGAYVRMPFEALLARIADESHRRQSIVIGEDLGTVPEGFRDTLATWGIWTYQVALFARGESGAFTDPAVYPRNALATFSTHDLPSFAGWLNGSDLGAKAALGIDPGETEEERSAARAALGEAAGGTVDFDHMIAWLARARSRLLVVAAEDVLGMTEQVNIPGTVDEHPNWRRRLPLGLEDWEADRRFRRAAELLAARDGR
jgi:4-alpha-glucanotransferase